MRRLSIYIHIPFCVRKCRYCDFLSFPASEAEKRLYVQALIREIETESVKYRQYTVSTIFIGGGTPTVLPEGLLEEILDTLRHSFSVAGNAEITIEANPGTADRETLDSYRRAGVTRLSIGTQSVHDRELKYLGRIHDSEDFYRTFAAAREAGFDNINVDIMSALPGQSVEGYRDNLIKIAELEPEHISAYSLIIEEGTQFYDMYAGKGSVSADVLPLPSEEEERQMYCLTEAVLQQYGYHRYEISNYALEGRECMHNRTYWERDDYVGFGIGAASMVENVRWKNTSDMEAYRECYVGSGNAAALEIRQELQVLSVNEQMEEFMFLGLRLTEGVSRQKFYLIFGKTMQEVYADVLERLEGQGLIESGERIRLTSYGRDISNYVMAEFLLDE